MVDLHPPHVYHGPHSAAPSEHSEDEPDCHEPSLEPPFQDLQNPSQINLIDPKTGSYKFQRYYARSFLNTLLPLLATGWYAFIVFGYLLKPSVNGVVPKRPFDANVAFFSWLILSIFLLDWAKSGLAGFEAAALMKPRLAPSNAMQLMWHLDSAWGSLSGWRRAIESLYRFVKAKAQSNQALQDAVWRGPGLLWWYLAANGLLLYVTLPLSGLAMNPSGALKLSSRKVLVLGVNETTFDVRTNAAVSQLTRDSWRTGHSTAPQAPAIFYAPQGAKNVSSTYFEDFVQDIYQRDLLAQAVTFRNITFFTGPPVAERAHGKAWGFLNTVECFPTGLAQGLELINASAYSQQPNSTVLGSMFTGAGLSPVFYFPDDGYGVNFSYVVASDRDIMGVGSGEYTNATFNSLPIKGSFEMVLWQSVSKGYQPDDGFTKMMDSPLVAQSDNGSTLGFGVRCTVISDVGTASLDAAKRMYSGFEQIPAAGNTNFNVPIFSYPGVFAIQSIVFQALATVQLGYMGPPSCLPGADVTCNAFYGANLATGGVPRVVRMAASGQALQVPTITPERMTLAMYKLFGEAAAAMMAIGPGNWTGELMGLDPAGDIVPYLIPWKLVLVLLCLWTVLTVIPQLCVFSEQRWSSRLTAAEMFRFGAEIQDHARHLGSRGFQENEVLRRLPSMIGDIAPGAQRGFVGLSSVSARSDRVYTNVKED
ncbi:hypothetical protein LTR70_009279 [Exophiala xenobiotica]|uniref:Uncharacterized protein n=1 Tax=Lithohypha guttulata TaxID=1690604 RepID=A0ABR0JZG0_9EURO|nr:hypothetical protein LTR24_009131 [Lithohypha guttulata]KAK5310712.1 hypothetical protein LTR70_009279 [Exophiala xenobiotica]